MLQEVAASNGECRERFCAVVEARRQRLQWLVAAVLLWVQRLRTSIVTSEAAGVNAGPGAENLPGGQLVGAKGRMGGVPTMEDRTAESMWHAGGGGRCHLGEAAYWSIGPRKGRVMRFVKGT